ncbi:transglutaminase-like domain-containing protein [Schlesneria paludicola]|uniref:transglutaminase-like domain-containing protein n=1 Tax=Schlesneria paludicola TaxID=360056 RepID=UPI00029ABA79|nr:transglutaminase-like domain-containing protein [Schlesneria paludicola]
MWVERLSHRAVRRLREDAANAPPSAGMALRTTPRLTWSLALLAILTFENSAGDGERTYAQILSLVTAEVLAVALSGKLVRRFARPETSHESRLTAIACLTIAVFAVELLVRAVSNSMLPLEQLLLILIRNAILALLLFANRQDCQRAACSLSLFLTIFTSTLSAHNWLIGSFVLFAVIGVFWLSDLHRETLRGRSIIRSTSHQTPSRWRAVLLLPLGFLLALPVAGLSTRALPGFMPSSGGKDWYFETAQGGVGDGDSLVAGIENIQSFAAIDDAPFLNSHEPSLYDMFDDSYNEPVKVEQQERAISISNPRSAQPSERDLAESQSVGKEFSTVRKSGQPNSGQIGNRTHNALLFVKGRVPLHLRLEAFDRFDGHDWTVDEFLGSGPSLQMERLNERPWLQISRPVDGAVFARPETHALKIIRLNSNRIPSPTQLLGVHIDKLDRTDFYRWAQPDILQMDRERLPSLTVIHLQSRIADVGKLEQLALQAHGDSGRYRKTEKGASSDRIEQLGRLWTESVPTGWPQIQQVIQHLRRDYVHDHDERPAADCTHTTIDFLFTAKRGPDYQFATAAVLLLRSLGYPARLVAGFYANPSRYDHRAQHTPVHSDDIHVWAEVSTIGGTWIPIEPTPGYELLRPLPTVWEILSDIVDTFWRWLVSHAVLVLVSSGTAVVLFLMRRTLVDRVEVLVWSWRSTRNVRARILATLRLMERRARRWGAACPQSISGSMWLMSLSVPQRGIERQTLIYFGRLADWAQFSPELTSLAEPDAEAVCRHTVQIWWRLPTTQLQLRSTKRPDRRWPETITHPNPLARTREMTTA